MLNPSELKKIDAYWRASNYLAAGQLYLLDNPMLRRPLTRDDVKKKIVGLHFSFRRFYHDCTLYALTFQLAAHFVNIIDFPFEVIGVCRTAAGHSGGQLQPPPAVGRV